MSTSATGAAPVPAPAPADDASAKRPPRFRRPANAIVLDAEQRRRQAAAMAAAWATFGARDAVMAFFNTHFDALDARPLDLAVDSDEGLARVEAVLRDAAIDHGAGGRG